MADEVKDGSTTTPNQAPVATINIVGSQPDSVKASPISSPQDPRTFESLAPWPKDKLRLWLRAVTTCDNVDHTRSCKNTAALVSYLVDKHGEDKMLSYFSRPEIQKRLRNSIPEMNSHVAIKEWLDNAGGLPLCFAQFFLEFANEQGTQVDSLFPRLRVEGGKRVSERGTTRQ